MSTTDRTNEIETGIEMAILTEETTAMACAMDARRYPEFASQYHHVAVEAAAAAGDLRTLLKT